MKDALLLAGLALALWAPVDSLDHRLQRAAQTARVPALERPMRWATDIGRPVIVVGALVAIGLADRAQGMATLRTAALVLLPTNAAVEVLKWTTFRTRPDGQRKRSNASFPSSHAANAFAIAWVLARRWRRGAPAFFALATLVAFSRVYLNRHFPGDVMVGAAIGTLFGAWGAPWAGRRGAPEDAAGGAP